MRDGHCVNRRLRRKFDATAAYLARRDALQAELRQAERDRAVAPTVAAADPGAVALAAYAGALGWKADAGQLGQWLPLRNFALLIGHCRYRGEYDTPTEE